MISLFQLYSLLDLVYNACSLSKVHSALLSPSPDLEEYPRNHCSGNNNLYFIIVVLWLERSAFSSSASFKPLYKSHIGLPSRDQKVLGGTSVSFPKFGSWFFMLQTLTHLSANSFIQSVLYLHSECSFWVSFGLSFTFIRSVLYLEFKCP